MKMRNVPVLQQYYEKKASTPGHMAVGFAAYLLFMKSEKNKEHSFTGNAGGKPYIINDDRAAELHELWRIDNTNNFVRNVLENTHLWGVNLDALPGFRQAVTDAVETIQKQGIAGALQKIQMRQTI
jgi:tagaturonate reductase